MVQLGFSLIATALLAAVANAGGVDVYDFAYPAGGTGSPSCIPACKVRLYDLDGCNGDFDVAGQCNVVFDRHNDSGTAKHTNCKVRFLTYKLLPSVSVETPKGVYTYYRKSCPQPGSKPGGAQCAVTSGHCTLVKFP